MAKLGDTIVDGSVDVKGIVTTPAQPAFCAALASNVTIPVVQTFYTLAPWTERFDLGGDFNATTGVFTAPIAGKYQFSANVDLRIIDTGSIYYWLRLITSKRGAYGNLFSSGQYTADLTYRGMFLSILTDMDAGDTAYLAIYQYSGTIQSHVLGNGNSVYTSFSGFLAC